MVITKLEFRAPADVAEEHIEQQLVPSSSALVKTWVNTDPATRGMVKIVIAAAGGGVSAHAFGACTPTPCDWGTVPGKVFSANVSSSTGIAFTAHYSFGFKNTTVTGHLNGKNLIVETFDEFTDGSARNNYYSSYTMA